MYHPRTLPKLPGGGRYGTDIESDDESDDAETVLQQVIA